MPSHLDTSALVVRIRSLELRAKVIVKEPGALVSGPGGTRDISRWWRERSDREPPVSMTPPTVSSPRPGRAREVSANTSDAACLIRPLLAPRWGAALNSINGHRRSGGSRSPSLALPPANLSHPSGGRCKGVSPILRKRPE
jgi:hypothetical protein